MILNSSFYTRTLMKVLGFVLLLCSCSSTPPDEDEVFAPSDRIIRFSGFEWLVRTTDDGLEGPGPNRFSDSDENVWVDEAGRLHLKIVQKGGLWYCSGITLRQSLGYGKYIFYVSSKVGELDQHAVAGLFTYKNDEEEIDIEFSKWSKPDNMDAQFAVQPSDLPGNKMRYNLDLPGELSTHVFHWQPEKIDFVSLQGHGLSQDEDNLIHEWTYTGGNIPPANGERLKINLWLFRGQSPSDRKEQELIIDHIEFVK